jgi:hypothetical protein
MKEQHILFPNNFGTPNLQAANEALHSNPPPPHPQPPPGWRNFINTVL